MRANAGGAGAKGMTEVKTDKVLRRIAEAGRTRSAEFTMTPAKAFRQSLAKAAQDLMQIGLRVPEVRADRISLAELPEAIEDRALLAIVEGPREGLGLVAISPNIMAGLIETLTIGRLGSGEVTPRRPTRTDAAMAAEFIDTSFQALEEMLAFEPDITWAGGFRYSSWLEDPRPLGLILEDTAYRLIRMNVDMGSTGTRQGGILIALPAEGKGSGPRRAGGAGGLEGAQDPAALAAAETAKWSADLGRTLRSAEVRLDAVLHRVKMPIAAVMQLRVGAVIPVPLDAVERLALEGRDGRERAEGSLGQAMGHRALRLTAILSDADEEAGAGPMGGAGGRAAGGADHLTGRAPYDDPGEDLASLGSGGGAMSMGLDLSLPMGGDEGDLPALGGLADLGDLPPLGGGLGEAGLGGTAMSRLPPLDEDEGEDLPPLAMAPMKIA